MVKEELYLEFRQEIDKICVPEILKCVHTHVIKYEGKDVGIFCYVYQPTHTYIDCIYIQPNYRRRGLAKKAVMEWYKEQKPTEEIRLHIIKKNIKALSFWMSIFELETIEGNDVDALYRIKGARI